MISRRRVVFRCVALVGVTCLVLFVTSSQRATSNDDEMHRLLGREHGNDPGSIDLQTALRTRIKSAQLNAGFRIIPELHQGGEALPAHQNVEMLDKPISQDEWEEQLPVLIDGEHLQDGLQRNHDPGQLEKQNKEPLAAVFKNDSIAIRNNVELDALVEDGVAEAAKVEVVPDKPPAVKNETAAAKTSRKRVRVIRKTVRNGKVVHEEVVGIKTVITNATKTIVRGNAHVRTYDEIWYSDILNGNFKANPIQLVNKTRDSPYLTEKLWRFQDTNSERLFLYERLLQHGWHRSLTNLMHLRQELHESGVDTENDLIITRDNAPLGAQLPFYITTKVPVGNKRAYTVTSEFRKHIPEKSPFRGKKYRSCAVVGNSGSLLDSGCGREIDDFDMIFRCNAAPINKYGHDAGWKSNITTFNPTIFYRRFNALQTREDYLHFKQNITQYNGYIWLACFGSAALHNVCLTPVLVEGSRKPNEPQLVLSNPNQFVNFWEFWKTRNISKTPSTGFFMTHAALELCEETHLYGFWPFPLRLDSGFERVRYHYFDDLVVSKLHGMSDEFSVFLQYHELGILQLHTGKCQSRKT